MKKWFKDEHSTQKMPEIESFSGAKDRFFFLLKFNRNKEGYSYQIYFDTIPSFDNNVYGIAIFDPDDKLLFGFPVNSNTALPPVWNREFGYIDYFDFLIIQKKINQAMAHNNYPLFEVDDDPKGKCFYFTTDWNPPCNSAAEMIERARKGERYGILSLFAEKRLDLVDQVKEWIKDI